MEKRKLGGNGTVVSALGIGAMSFADFYGPTDTEKSHAILSTALDLGIDHIDTSNVYGQGISEERIGSFLSQQGPGRHELFTIATKAGICRGDDGKNYDNSPGHLEAELDKSLKRLGVDHVELFYVHRREQELPIEEVAGTLAGFIRAGKIKQFGFSEIAPTSLALAAAVHPVGAVQSEYSLSTRYPELGLVQKTAELDTTLVAFSPLGRSLLTDSPHSEENVQTFPFLKDNPRFLEPNLSRNVEATAGFRALARDMGHKASSLAIAWVLHQGAHILPIPGTRSTDHLRELAKGAELSLSSADLKAINQQLPVGWAHGDRYSVPQWAGPEKYC
ncbi:MAG: aldo/keto reductase [Rhodospirillaceae bacterium]|jgi:aryl-alcohol dehydrogenase-like predicted oxidoreductase|nr:aldo/keto reductase [Rhodospirillaceae bacterium]MBT5244502.1 aldo/keto reductase [Rhodospirillaceae bacterium]MBT5560759.1 aldo/keto reductase [Rhodospirillaceae bacterium]MBT6241598.1 aldo/keto reductase [Rhodospirillaceae bacterium]MBT7136384.1 aldo/keto reductase [Rhodospirillaceae bacterium]